MHQTWLNPLPLAIRFFFFCVCFALSSNANERNVIILPLEKETPTWHDLLYLSAIPASAKVNGGTPMVLATDVYGTLRPEARDYLSRLNPTRIYAFDCFDTLKPPSQESLACWYTSLTSGNSFVDAFGSRKASYQTLPTWDTRAVDNRTFDGRTIDFKSGIVPGSGAELTVAFWVNSAKAQNSQPLCKLDNNDRGLGWKINFDNRKRPSVHFTVGGGRGGWGASRVTVENAFEIGQWVHLAFTHKNGTSKIYVDGNLRATRENITWSTPNNFSDPLFIGSSEKHGARFAGLMDDISIYHTALKDEDVVALSNGRQIMTPGSVPIAHWTMDKLENGVLKDSTGRFDLDVTGAPSFETGRLGSAIRFSGEERPKVQLRMDNEAVKPFSMSVEVTAGHTTEPVLLLNKLHTADQSPPWSLWTQPTAEGIKLAFQLGSNREHRVLSDTVLTIGKPTSVAACVENGAVTLYVNGKIAGKHAGFNWEESAAALPRNRMHDHFIDHVVVYNRMLSSSEFATLQQADAPSDKTAIVQQSSVAQRAKMSGMIPTSLAQGRRNGKVLRFDGSGYVDCGKLDFSGNLTVAFWVKADGPCCVMNALSATPEEPGWGVFLDGPMDQFKLSFRAGVKEGKKYAELSQQEAYVPNEWVHVGICIKDSIITLYLDGRFADSKKLPEGTNLKTELPFLIGALEPGVQTFKGCLDDLRIYKRALNEKEVLSLFAEPISFENTQMIPAPNLSSATCALARVFWGHSDTVVFCSDQDYGGALSASALAGRLRAPLFFSGPQGLDPLVLKTLSSLNAKNALWVGPDGPANQQLAGAGLAVTPLATPVEVLVWMKKKGMPINYFSAANPLDRESVGLVRKTSLIAPLMAVVRQGVVTLLDFETVWLQPFPVKRTHQYAPEGVVESKKDYKFGSVIVGGKEIQYVISNRDKPWKRRVQFDIDGDGRYDSANERPIENLSEATIHGRTYGVTMGPLRGSVKDEVVNITWPTPKDIREKLSRYAQALGSYPEYLCIMGRSDVIASGLGPSVVNEHNYIPSDVQIAQTDDDPFVELATGRIIAEDVWSATLIATRILSYELLLNKLWMNRYGSAGWNHTFDDVFRSVGFVGEPHQRSGDHLSPDDAVSSVNGFTHCDHSTPEELGGFSHWSSKVLIAPSVIESGGCTTCLMKPNVAHQSAPMRLLRNGAVGYSGNSVQGICTQDLYRYDFWNEILSGKTLGQAHLQAQNAYIPELKGHTFFSYQFYARTLFGDPAFRMYCPSKPALKGARLEENGDVISVIGPEKWWIKNKYEADATRKPSYYLTALNISMESVFGSGKSWYYIAKLRTTKKVSSIEQITNVEKPLGWDGKFYIDEHQDGSRTLVWRVKLVDFDENSGTFSKKVDRIDYRVSFE